MYRRRAQGWMKHLDFLLIDLISFQLAFCLAGIMRHGLTNPYGLLMYRNTAIVTVLIQIFIIIGTNIFHEVLQRGYYQEFTNTVKTVSSVMLVTVFYLFAIQKGSSYSRTVLLASTLYYWAFAFLFRCIWKYFLRLRVAEQKGSKSLIVITSRERVEKVVANIQKNNFSGLCLSGIILTDDICPDETVMDIPVVSGKEGAAEYLCRDWVDEVYLDVSESDSFFDEMLGVLTEMSMVVHVPIGKDEKYIGQKKEIQTMGDEMVLTMSANILNLRDALIKRTMDIVGGLVGCLITGILFLFLAPVIFIKSPGPIFFSQTRVGRNGRMFRIYKFRSMYMDAEERKRELMSQNEVEDGMMFKIENDPRIIGSEKGAGRGIGNFIRKTSLDEFPQFFNVLKGDMSLVGTRPPTVDEWEKYNFFHRSRLSIKPGLTGMWQVSGRSDIKDFDEVVALDRKYIAQWSLALDIKILVMTIFIVLRGDGAR